MKKEKNRDSKFELLRILAMALITIHHLFYHVMKWELSKDYIYGPFEMFNNPAFYKRLCILELPSVAGKLGDVLFILITGYFLCGKKKIDEKKSIIKLVSQVFFASIVLIISSIFYQKFFDLKISNMANIFYFNNEWWFIGYYLAIILIGKFLLNNFISKLTKRQYESFLLIIFTLVSLQYTRCFFSAIYSELPTLVMGIFIYSMGGYIKKYDFLKKVKSRYLYFTIVICLVFCVLSYRSLVLTTINQNGGNIFYQPLTLYSDYNLIPLVLGISIFELFKRMRVKESKIINSVAASTLMIYLIHDNGFFRSLLKKVNFVKPLYENVFMFCILNILITLGIFILGYIMYYIYSFIFKKITTRKNA